MLREGIRRLQAAGVEHARHEAEWLIGRVVGARPLNLYVEEPEISPELAARFLRQIGERCAGIPLQYLLGEAEFYGAPFLVEPGVFIPRPETEIIVEAALHALRERQTQLGRPLRLLDAGTGSGCIALSLARCLPTCLVVGVELSWNALRVAQRNAERHALTARVRFVQAQWLEAIRGRFDGLVANPPYVPSAQVDYLPLDVRHEPRVSLDGGPDGMRDLRALLERVPRIMNPGGIVVFECAEEQVDELLRMGQTLEWIARVSPLHDVAQRPRGVLIHRA